MGLGLYRVYRLSFRLIQLAWVRLFATGMLSENAISLGIEMSFILRHGTIHIDYQINKGVVLKFFFLIMYNDRGRRESRIVDVVPYWRLRISPRLRNPVLFHRWYHRIRPRLRDPVLFHRWYHRIGAGVTKFRIVPPVVPSYWLRLRDPYCSTGGPVVLAPGLTKFCIVPPVVPGLKTPGYKQKDPCRGLSPRMIRC